MISKAKFSHRFLKFITKHTIQNYSKLNLKINFKTHNSKLFSKLKTKHFSKLYFKRKNSKNYYFFFLKIIFRIIIWVWNRVLSYEFWIEFWKEKICLVMSFEKSFELYLNFYEFIFFKYFLILFFLGSIFYILNIN